MTALALPGTDLFSVVTTSGRDVQSPLWKSLLERIPFGHDHVEFSARTPAQRNIWAAKLDEAVMRAAKPVLLVASGESSIAAAWWARLSPADYVSRVAGALLFAPHGRAASDSDGQFASPRISLPFPSAIVEESKGVIDSRLHLLAQGWGSRIVEQDWDQPVIAEEGTHSLWERITARVIERRFRVAEAFGITA